MVRLFVLIRRKGSKRFLGAIPTRKGSTRASLMRILPRKIKKGFVFKIINEKQLKRLILKQRPRKRPMRRVKRRLRSRRLIPKRRRIKRTRRR